MALFFRRKPTVSRHEVDSTSDDPESHGVSRETVFDVPTAPRRAAYEVPEDYTGEHDGDEDNEYGLEYEPESTTQVLPRPDRTRIFVVANQKGGVGKTTTSVNIAMALALGGLNVLVIDVDPQGNASTALGLDHGPGTPGTYEVLLASAAIADVAQQSPHTPNLHVLPATIDLAAAELELVGESGRESRMKRAVQKYIETSGVDYIIFDCPPSLGLLTLNALVAASEILVPIQCEYYALEGVSHLMRTIERVKGNLNNDLQLSTILLTMYDARTKLSQEVAREVRSHFPEETLGVEIPRSVRIAEAPSYGETVITYQSNSSGATAYLKAAEEIAARQRHSGKKGN